MKRVLSIFAFCLVLAPAVASAGGSGVELTVFAGYRSGDEFNVADAFDDFLLPGLEIEDSEVYGAALGIPLTGHLSLEFLYTTQDTTLIEKGGLFEPDFELSDIDVSYVHAGVQYEWAPGQVRPFVGAGLGVAVLDPSAFFLDQESRLSGHLGGGVKVFFTDHFGLRIEGRALWIDLDDEDFNDDRCCRNRRRETDDIFQAEATAGIVVKF